MPFETGAGTGQWHECAWPSLGEPFGAALREAVAFVFARFQPVGIVVAGRIVRGDPHPASDLDIYVVHPKPARRRIQRRFRGVPAEIFVNPAAQVRRYFASERATGRPSTAHMLATGFVVFERGDTLAAPRAEAQAVLAAGPDTSSRTLLSMRCAVADLFGNALDMTGSDAEMADSLLARAVDGAVALRFRTAGRWRPSAKDTLHELETLDPAAAGTVRAFWRAADTGSRVALAHEALRQCGGEHAFFEWESPDH